MNIDEQREWLDNHKDEVGEWILVNDKWYEREAYETYLLSTDPNEHIVGIYPPFMAETIRNYEE